MPLRSFGIRSSTSPALVDSSRGRCPLRSVTRVSAALVRCGADPLGRLGFDQFLQHQPDRLTDQIHAVTGAERLEQLGQGRLGQGHRWTPSCALGRSHRRSRRWPPHVDPAGYLKPHHSTGRLPPANGHPMQNQ